MNRTAAAPKVPNLVFLLQNGCNLRCKMCGVWKQDKRIFPTEMVRKIQPQLKELATHTVVLTGGEPMLQIPPLLDALQQFQAVPNRVVVTNGTLLDEVACRSLLDTELEHLVVSLDGPSEIHDLLRGQPVFDILVDNMARLRGLRNVSSDTKLYATMTVNRLNLDYIEQTSKVALDLGFDHFEIQAVTVSPHAFSMGAEVASYRKLLWPTNDQHPTLSDQIEALRTQASQHPGFILNSPDYLKAIEEYFFCNPSTVRLPCSAWRKSLTVAADGGVFLCSLYHTVGNIRRLSISEILDSPAATEVKGRMARCSLGCLLFCHHPELEEPWRVA